MKKVISLILVLLIFIQTPIVFAKTYEYEDVPEAKWSHRYIVAISEQGLASGYGNGKFGATDLVKISEMIAFAIRVAGIESQVVKGSTWDSGYINLAVKLGWYSKSYLDDNKSKAITREEALNLLHIAISYGTNKTKYKVTNVLDYSKIEFKDKHNITKPNVISDMFNWGMIAGTEQGKLNPQSTLTREEIATLIIRTVDKDYRETKLPVIVETPAEKTQAQKLKVVTDKIAAGMSTYKEKYSYAATPLKELYKKSGLYYLDYDWDIYGLTYNYAKWLDAEDARTNIHFPSDYSLKLTEKVSQIYYDNLKFYEENGEYYVKGIIPEVPLGLECMIFIDIKNKSDFVGDNNTVYQTISFRPTRDEGKVTSGINYIISPTAKEFKVKIPNIKNPKDKQIDSQFKVSMVGSGGGDYYYTQLSVNVQLDPNRALVKQSVGYETVDKVTDKLIYKNLKYDFSKLWEPLK